MVCKKKGTPFFCRFLFLILTFFSSYHSCVFFSFCRFFPLARGFFVLGWMEQLIVHVCVCVRACPTHTRLKERRIFDDVPPTQPTTRKESMSWMKMEDVKHCDLDEIEFVERENSRRYLWFFSPEEGYPAFFPILGTSSPFLFFKTILSDFLLEDSFFSFRHCSFSVRKNVHSEPLFNVSWKNGKETVRMFFFLLDRLWEMRVCLTKKYAHFLLVSQLENDITLFSFSHVLSRNNEKSGLKMVFTNRNDLISDYRKLDYLPWLLSTLKFSSFFFFDVISSLFFLLNCWGLFYFTFSCLLRKWMVCHARIFLSLHLLLLSFHQFSLFFKGDVFTVSKEMLKKKNEEK